MRMAEGQVQVEAIRSGLYELVPKEALSLFTWIELRELVCKAVPLAPSLACLQERAVYGGGLSADSTHIQRFWRVLHNMDQVSVPTRWHSARYISVFRYKFCVR